MLISLTVGKVDAGVAVLLTEDKRLASLLQSFCAKHLNPADPPASDRIPLYSSSSIYFFREHCRHNSLSQSCLGNCSPQNLPSTPILHPCHIRPALSLTAPSSLQERDSNVSRPGMGPDRSCHCRLALSKPLPQWQQSRQHSATLGHYGYENQRAGY